MRYASACRITFLPAEYNIILICVVFEQIGGLMLIGAGLFLIIYFPDTEDLEFGPFTLVAIFAGLFLLIIGIRLLLG